MAEEFVYVNADTGEQVNPGNANNSYVPTGTSYKADKADLLEKIKPDLIVEVIKHKLMGEELNIKTQKWEPVEALKEYALTRIGAEMISNLMLGVSSQNVSLSSLKDREIKQRLLEISKTAQYMALENWIEFGIKRRTQFYFIHQIVYSNSLVVLKQPEGEGIRKLIAGTITENRVYNQQNEKEGGLKGLFRR